MTPAKDKPSQPRRRRGLVDAVWAKCPTCSRPHLYLMRYGCRHDPPLSPVVLQQKLHKERPRLSRRDLRSYRRPN